MPRFSTEPLNFVCSRRELPGKLFAIGVAFLLLPKSLPSKTPSQLTEPQSEPQSEPLRTKSQPAFKIGDLVATDWEGDEDEDAPQSATDFGEIVGMCYLPEDGLYYSRHTWVYYVYWTHSTSNTCLYPCFDGEMIEGNALRLVNHA